MSATRPSQNIQNGLIEKFTASGGIAKYMPVKFGADDLTVVQAGAGDDPIGIAQDTAVDGADLTVLLFCTSIVAVTVGTGGATRGAYAICAADGLTDKALGGGTVAQHVSGRFRQSGVAGDRVGLMVGGNFTGVSA